MTERDPRAPARPDPTGGRGGYGLPGGPGKPGVPEDGQDAGHARRPGSQGGSTTAASGARGASPAGAGERAGPSGAPGPVPAWSADQVETTLNLEDALVVPAGALVRGYMRLRALLLSGDIVGNVHCAAGPVVIRAGASLKGRLVAAGDVFIYGSVGDHGGGPVISTSGKLTLAPGSQVDGDVRCRWLDIHEGATLRGVGRAIAD